MISFLKGALAGKSESGVIIDVGGVGYSVSMPASDIAKIGDIGEKVTVYTHFHMSVMSYIRISSMYSVSDSLKGPRKHSMISRKLQYHIRWQKSCTVTNLL